MDNMLFSACQFAEQKLDWQSAIKLACQPLEEQKYVSAGYADSIILTTEQNGPWYVLSPEFALPHARPEEGVLSQQSLLSLLCCAEEVAFPGYPNVRLIVVLAAADSEQHILMIQRLVCWLDEDERLAQFANVENREQFISLINNQL